MGGIFVWREAVILSKQGRVVDDRPFTEVVVKLPVKTAYRYTGSKNAKIWEYVSINLYVSINRIFSSVIASERSVH